MECKWIDNISPYIFLFDSSTCCLFLFFSNIKAMFSNVAFTVAVYTLKVALSFACFSELPECSYALSSLLFLSEAMGSIAYYVKPICNRMQVNSDSLVFKCITESIRP